MEDWKIFAIGLFILAIAAVVYFSVDVDFQPIAFLVAFLGVVVAAVGWIGKR